MNEVLSQAIARAIEQMRTSAKPPMTYQEAARRALLIIDLFVDALASLTIPHTDRLRVVTALLLASMDQAHAFCFLIANDAERSFFSSFILHRSHIDHFLRGAFFAGPATDEEFDYFLKKDEMPRFNGKAMGTKKIAERVSQHFPWKAEDKLYNMVDDAWKPLSGFTHGGHSLLTVYAGKRDIGAQIELQDLVEVVINTTVMVFMAFDVAVNISVAKNTPESAKAVNEAIEELGDFLKNWNPS